MAMTEGRLPETRDRFSILLIDDDHATLGLIREMLSPFKADLEFYEASSAEEALNLMQAVRPSFVFLDLMMPGVERFELLDRLIRIDPFAEIALLTGNYSMDAAVEAIKRGASDYLTKPVTAVRLRQRVEKWLSLARTQEQALALDSISTEGDDFEGMIGRSPLMLDLYSRINRIAPHFSNALVIGDTGTGKELVARALHRLGAGPDAPFVVCNCAAVTETLFESSLFGHFRGSFTGAVSNHKGMIEAAAGGTLFLDEIGEVPPGSQAKLLRFLQSREIQPLGSSQSRKVVVRVVAATNRPLEDMVAERTFREDLYYRLASVALQLPRLCERREDIPLLALHFLSVCARKYGLPPLRLTRRTQAFLLRYHWPGNVRELESALSYAVMMCGSEPIDLIDLPDALRRAAAENAGVEPEVQPLEVQTRRYVMEVLARFNGNRSRAAEVLEIGRTTLYRILKRGP
ncbi:MAG: sigma-54 dependent transcriptional regulator [Bryobacteraceae bacterium]|nr:sigma-54 dependent transcriptional regulator [Bryobacteraceae bacterium]